jgi:hypothetical protein
MNHLSSVLFILCSFFVLSQSKKEQIEDLNFQIDSLKSTLTIERLDFNKSKETLSFDLQNLQTQKEKLLVENDRLSKEIENCRLENNLSVNRLKKLEDSLSNSNKFQIISFLMNEETEIIAGPIILVDYAVLQISKNELRGFIGKAGQDEWGYFISGIVVNDSYIGDVYYIGCETDCESSTGKFQLKIENSNLNLSGAARGFHDEIPIYNGKHIFHGNLMSEANINSKTLMLDFSNDIENRAEILEIGNYEKINDNYDLWYKVKINGLIGWVFGGLCTVCPEPN